MLSEQQKKVLKVIAIILIKKKMNKRGVGRRPDTDSILSGHEYVNEIMQGNPAHSQEMLRMSKEAFSNLCEYFRGKGWLQNSRYISVEEKMAMFLYSLSQQHTMRSIKRRFNHSTHTMHTYFYEVLLAMLKFSKEMIVPNYTPSINENTQHRRLREIFQV